MSRRAITMGVAAAALATGAAAAFGAAGAAHAPLAAVRVSKCSRADHLAVFHSRMRRVRQTERMSMRFTLLERAGTGAFRPVDAPKLRRWRKSRPGVRVFGFRQWVRGLSDGAAYRALVRYRWYDAQGRLLKRARRRSRACRQYGPLPNLRVTALLVRPGPTAGTRWYVARVANTGEATATGVRVELSADGAALNTVTLDRLEPGEVRAARATGPPCRWEGSPVEAVVDPGDDIRESSETDNLRAASCALVRER